MSARILVADDDPELLAGIRDALTQRGALVSCAASGAELIVSLAREGPYELIITDISMPWGSGLQAMHPARTAGVHCAVLIMTALQEEELRGSVAALGDNAELLRKPFDLSALEAAAARLLRHSAAAGSGSGAAAAEAVASEWSGRVAHDLQQPVNTLLLRTDMFLRSVPLQGEQREGLLRIRELTKRLGSMIQDLQSTPSGEARAGFGD